MSFNPNANRYSMESLKICDKCDDMGYVIGEKKHGNHPLLVERWKEVCPYCMPTAKYGNLRNILKLTPKLLPYDDNNSIKDAGNNDEDTNPNDK